MFCPSCKDEFREGFVHCKKCDVDLVESLNNNEKEQNKELDFRARYLGFMKWEIEKWLKVGGLTLIIVSVLYEIVKAIRDFIPKIDQLTHSVAQGVTLFSILGLIYILIKDIMWGLFYIGLGYIIEFLKEGKNNEKV